METRDRLSGVQTDQTDESTSDCPEQSVTAHKTSPERFVFTDADNTDAWIATDTTVELRQ